MKTFKLSGIAMIIFIVFLSCRSDYNNSTSKSSKINLVNTKPDSGDIIKVIAKDFSFQVDDEINSGWTTFNFENRGHTVHFFLLNLLPDTISYSEYHEKVSIPFQIVFDSIKEGMSKADAGGMLGKILPGWYFSGVQSMGGTGFIDQGKTSQITVNLIPGTYVMECYIKEKGVFHTTLGMMKEVKVLEESSNINPPKPNIKITLTNHLITPIGEMKKGKNTVSVYFKEHPKIGLGNDVHLIKLADESKIDKVIYWLDWMNIDGLEPPSPAEFLGGIQEMPIGSIGYFTVHLESGNYAWISESYGALGMVNKFSVR